MSPGKYLLCKVSYVKMLGDNKRKVTSKIQIP